jgi:hypothetical protein
MGTSHYDGDWMATYSGGRFHPLTPKVEDISIVDIAHALSLQCRYAGHTNVLYSTAEHCIHIASVLPDELKLWGLLHDASEAYLVDIPRPLKRYLPDYREIERRVMDVICDSFNLCRQEPALVRELDDRIIENERRELMTASDGWDANREPLPGVTIYAWSPAQAEQRFLCDFLKYGGSINYWK